jgi:hypothetical protein
MLVFLDLKEVDTSKITEKRNEYMRHYFSLAQEPSTYLNSVSSRAYTTHRRQESTEIASPAPALLTLAVSTRHPPVTAAI